MPHLMDGTCRILCATSGKTRTFAKKVRVFYFNMIQDIYPHRFDNQYKPSAVMGEHDYVFHFRGNTLLLKHEGDKLDLPKKQELPKLTSDTPSVFLFTLNQVACFLVWEDPGVDDPSFSYEPMDIFRTIKEQEIAWICLAGFHLYTWYSRTIFCGTCGSKMRHKSDERAMECPHCHSIFYPTIAPAVIVAIVNDQNILLVRGGRNTKGRYTLVSGFVEVGETLEEAVVREVKEETGIDVRSIRYYKNQPWPLSGSMMVGFIAEADRNQPLVVDYSELNDAAWFSREHLPDHSLPLSIAGEMIEQFEKEALC